MMSGRGLGSSFFGRCGKAGERLLQRHASSSSSGLATSYRTHTCGSVHQIAAPEGKGGGGGEGEGTKVRLVGWLSHLRRLNAGLMFAGLRDGYGQVEVMSTQQTSGLAALESANKESIVSIEGVVRPRVRATDEKNSGAVENEVHAIRVEVLNASELLPTPFEEPSTETQQLAMLKHRYLALRLPRLQRNLRMRSKVSCAIRSFLAEECGFVEVETPTLFRPTAEGAREFLVPTRRRAGAFYALPQSPQQYKQLLMAGGLDRYFQLARCYRDEDHRSDRQPEFTQVDLEMSFVRAQEVRQLIEGLLGRIWKILGLEPLPHTFPIMRYQDAMERYGV